ncbi:BTB/POZ domain-containing protein 2-like isoform X2 [Cimex lectularius]|uniref:BTB domain-containing protein n=1 Tax=Cimex lectularius TaxID=79782 RepID=A0A8I6SRN2_CIMLE|nr:BTB/POZ domain-containing protein 2-like isoform X2 [Cimex lectularius]
MKTFELVGFLNICDYKRERKKIQKDGCYRFSYMFNNEVLSDVHFLVGREPLRQRIPAHKLVLTAGSAVFDAMFNGTLATTAPEIELPDIEPSAFLALLRFLYTDEVQIGPETVMTTLYTAKKYAVPTLEGHCVDFLKRNLRADNAFMLLTQARLFDEPQLASLCLDTIDKNTFEAVSADGFTDVDLETLIAVLERDTLHIRETKLYQAVIRWGEVRCQRRQLPVTPDNLRSALDSALSLIRFPLMGLEEFAQGPAQSGVLTDREVVSLFLYFTVNPKPPLRFKDSPRGLMTGQLSVNRFKQVEWRWGYSGTSDRIGFSVNRKIYVVGLGLYGTPHGRGPSEYEVTIEIVLPLSGRICSSNITRVSSDGNCPTFKVMFKEPIEIRPNTPYHASAKIRGPDTHYGTKGQRRVEVDCGNYGKVVFQFTYVAGTNNGTSVESGQIPEILFYT